MSYTSSLCRACSRNIKHIKSRLHTYSYTKSFTLIELLVVIAIIAILASVTLVSIAGAKTRAKDAKIVTQLSSITNQAELYFASNGNYGVTTSGTPNYNCVTGGFSLNEGGGMFTGGTADNGVFTLLAALAQSLNSSTTLSNSDALCNYSPTTNTTAVRAWSIAIKGATSGKFFCIDSTGVSRTYTSSTSPAATALTGSPGTGVISAAGSTVCQ
jgi:type IV pilus assembly protein PilA